MSVMPFRVQISVRFRDVDVLGHVNNAVYFTYMETARTEYWLKTFGAKDLQGLSFIVAHAECDFKKPALYGDQLEVTIRTTSVRNSSFDWEYEIRKIDSGELIAKGKTIQVYYDYKTLQSSAVPPHVREKLLA
jgi:acyl-CoA thioester hydrolase